LIGRAARIAGVAGRAAPAAGWSGDSHRKRRGRTVPAAECRARVAALTAASSDVPPRQRLWAVVGLRSWWARQGVDRVIGGVS